MKVLFLIRSLEVGGAEHQMAMLASQLVKSGYQVKVVVFYQKGAFQEILKKAKVEVLSLHKKSRWDLMGPLSRLFKIFQQERPDILYSFLPVANLLSILLHWCFPKMKIIWGIRASNMDLRQYDWLSRVLSKWEIKMSRYADCIIVNAHRGRAEIQRLGFQNKCMRVIPNGINTEKFLPDDSKRSKFRAEWHIKEDEYLIGHVARFDPMKDHETFLRSAAILSKRLHNVRFMCVGEGSDTYFEKLKTLVLSLGLNDKVVWTGMRRDLEAIYNAFDVCCSSSAFGEGFSNVLGEAMATGVPCVATDVGDAACILGELGYIVAPGDPQALADACYQALTLKDIPKNKLRDRIVENFSLSTMVDNTKKIFEQISEKHCRI